jgi:hypothetical protein
MAAPATRAASATEAAASAATGPAAEITLVDGGREAGALQDLATAHWKPVKGVRADGVLVQ